MKPRPAVLMLFAGTTPAAQWLISLAAHPARG